VSPVDPVAQVLPGGAKHANLVAYLDEVAGLAAQFTDASGELFPVVYRPWQHHNGDEYWWSTPNATEGEIVALFQFTVHYLRDVKGVHNLLYAFSPSGSFADEAEYLYGYPGDEYVDVLGFDSYFDVPTGNPTWYAQLSRSAGIVSAYADAHGKIAALTETGIRYDSGSHGVHVSDHYRYPLDWWTGVVDAIQSVGAGLAYFAVPGNVDSDVFWVPFKDHATLGNHPMLADFIEMYNDDQVVLADRVGSYTTLVGPTADNTVKLAPGVNIVAPAAKTRISGTQTIYVEANARVVPCVRQLSPAGDCPAGNTGRLTSPTSVEVSVDGQVVAASAGTGANPLWTATIDSTVLGEGPVTVTAEVTYNVISGGLLYAAMDTTTQGVIVENTPTTPTVDPYVIDDFEAYDGGVNRTDVERVWWRDTDVANAVRVVPSTSPVMTGNVLSVKYDVVDKNGTTDLASGVTQSFPAPYRDWSAVKSFGVVVQPDGKGHGLVFRLTTGTGPADVFDCDFASTGVTFGYDPALVTPQRVVVPIGCFTNTDGDAPTVAELAEVQGFGIRIVEDPTKGHVAGVNATESYLLDDLTVTTTDAAPAHLETALRLAVDYYTALFDPALYTPVSYAPLDAALRGARAAIANHAVTQTVYDYYLGAFQAATADGQLVFRTDTTYLRDLLVEAHLILDDADSHAPSSLVDLRDAITDTEDLLEDANVSEEAVWDQFVALQTAIEGVVKLGDKTALTALVSVVRGLNSNLLTPNSWATVTAALDVADGVLADPEASEYAVTDAYTGLTGAVNGLVVKASKTGLQSAVTLAATILGARALYIESSLDGLEDALGVAQGVLGDDNATQAQVSAAQSALIVKIAAARVKPIGGSPELAPPLSPETAAAAAQDPTGVAEAVAEAQADAPVAVPLTPTQRAEVLDAAPEAPALVAPVEVTPVEVETEAEVPVTDAIVRVFADAVTVAGTLVETAKHTTQAPAPAVAQDVAPAPAPAVEAPTDSVPVAAPAAGKAQFAKVAAPKITGKAVVGKRLTAQVKGFQPQAKVSYQWLRNGKKIANATKAAYTLRSSDLGARISVKITAKKTGYTTVVKVSPKTTTVR
jgi:hypothetical protein